MKPPTNGVRSKRYRIIGDLQSRAQTPSGWHATDLAFGDDVVIYPLPADFRADPGQVGMFETAFARACEAAYPGTVGWHSLDLAAGVAIREWVNGFTLMSLLRRRQKLTVSEVVALLNGLPELLDWLSAYEMTPAGDLLEESWVAFQPGVPTARLVDTPFSRWPSHQIKLALLHPRDFWKSDAESASQATLRTGAPSGAVSSRLALLFRELLGDRIRSKPWTPMPALNERANDLLADTLNSASLLSARDFWTAMVASVGDDGSQSQGAKTRTDSSAFRIPPARQADPCRVAILEPQDSANPPIRLCAGAEFQFGRDESLADFRTILLPETTENKTLSGEISRAHARLEARDGALWLRDGDGETASHNGTQWDDIAISANGSVRMYGRGVLNLANQYSLALTPVPGEFARGLTLGGRAVGSPSSMLPSAVIPSSIGGQKPFRRAVWILSALGFHLDAAGDIEWHHSGGIAPAGVFIRDNGGFWLANAGLPARAIRVGEDEPQPGEAVPLVSGQSLRIGDRIYNVRVVTPQSHADA